MATTTAPTFSERAPDQMRTLVELELPVELQHCGTAPDECGLRKLDGTRPGFAATIAGTLLVAPTDCAEVIEFNLERGCARALEVEGDAWPTGADSAGQSTLTAHGERVFLRAPEGRLLEATWPAVPGS